MTDATVELDTRELEAGIRQLAGGIGRRISPVALAQATETARRIRSPMPRRSGYAASSVTVRRGRAGGAIADASVTAGAPYFGWLNWGGTRGRPYVSAGRYTGPALAGAGATFHAACSAAAAQEIRHL